MLTLLLLLRNKYLVHYLVIWFTFQFAVSMPRSDRGALLRARFAVRLLGYISSNFQPAIVLRNKIRLKY